MLRPLQYQGEIQIPERHHIVSSVPRPLLLYCHDLPPPRLMRNKRTRAVAAASPSPFPPSSPMSISSPRSQALPSPSKASPNLGGPKKASTLLRRCSNVINASPVGFKSACDTRTHTHTRAGGGESKVGYKSRAFN